MLTKLPRPQMSIVVISLYKWQSLLLLVAQGWLVGCLEFLLYYQCVLEPFLWLIFIMYEGWRSKARPLISIRSFIRSSSPFHNAEPVSHSRITLGRSSRVPIPLGEYVVSGKTVRVFSHFWFSSGGANGLADPEDWALIIIWFMP